MRDAPVVEALMLERLCPGLRFGQCTHSISQARVIRACTRHWCSPHLELTRFRDGYGLDSQAIIVV